MVLFHLSRMSIKMLISTSVSLRWRLFSGKCTVKLHKRWTSVLPWFWWQDIYFGQIRARRESILNIFLFNYSIPFKIHRGVKMKPWLLSLITTSKISPHQEELHISRSDQSDQSGTENKLTLIFLHLITLKLNLR